MAALMLTRWFCVGASARLCSQATVSTSAIGSASASASASAGRWFCTSNPKAQEEEEEAKGKTPAGEGEENTRWKVGEPIQGINYNKGGTDPKILEDNEYPDWLWRMLDPKPTLSELERKLEPVISREINGIGELRELMEH